MKKRVAGIEILRFIAMLMIVICHVVIWNDLDHDFWLTGFAAFGGLGVNIFGMITGYVSYTEEERQFKPQKYWRTWLTAFFYSVGITLWWKMSTPDQVSMKMLAVSFLPVFSTEWWYFSSWTAVFFLQPLLLVLVRNLQLTRRNTCVYILVFSVYATVAGLFKDPFGLKWGFSPFWLCILFIIGAMLKKHNIADKFSPTNMGWGLAAIFACLFIVTPMVAKLSVYVLGQPIAYKLLTEYTSPLMIGGAMLMLLAFARTEIHEKAEQLLNYLGPASFGIYIIHCHPYIKSIIEKHGILLQDGSVLKRVGLVLGAAVIIFSVCLLCEIIRIHMFNLPGFILKGKKK